MKMADVILFVGGIVLGNEKGREWCLKNIKKASVIIDEKMKELPLAIGKLKNDGNIQSDCGHIRDSNSDIVPTASKQSEDISRNAEGFSRNSRFDSESDSKS